MPKESKKKQAAGSAREADAASAIACLFEVASRELQEERTPTSPMLPSVPSAGPLPGINLEKRFVEEKPVIELKKEKQGAFTSTQTGVRFSPYTRPDTCVKLEVQQPQQQQQAPAPSAHQAQHLQSLPALDVVINQQLCYFLDPVITPFPPAERIAMAVKQTGLSVEAVEAWLAVARRWIVAERLAKRSRAAAAPSMPPAVTAPSSYNPLYPL